MTLFADAIRGPVLLEWPHPFTGIEFFATIRAAGESFQPLSLFLIFCRSSNIWNQFKFLQCCKERRCICVKRLLTASGNRNVKECARLCGSRLIPCTRGVGLYPHRNRKKKKNQNQPATFMCDGGECRHANDREPGCPRRNSAFSDRNRAFLSTKLFSTTMEIARNL